MYNLLQKLDLGNIAQWASVVITLVFTIKISKHGNTLKELELSYKKSQDWSKKWSEKSAPVLRFPHWLKRGLERNKYSDADIEKYQAKLEDIMWQILPWEIGHEGWLLFIDRKLRILYDQKDMEKRKLIVEDLIPQLTGISEGASDQFLKEAHEDADAE